MSHHCCAGETKPAATRDPRYRRVLWAALVINAAMFAVEIGGGMQTGSTSLLADAIDFMGDAANYGMSLAVLSLGALWQSRTALIKAWCMGAFGCFVLGKAAWSMITGVLPEPLAMGMIGVLALCANLSVAALLYTYRSGDANMRSVWLCTRNDAIGNAAVMLAAAGVFGAGSGWPDWLAALLMGMLALNASVTVVRHARAEMIKPTSPIKHHAHEKGHTN